MIDRINQSIPAFLLKPEYRIYRHLLIQLIVVLITVNIFWDQPDRIQPGRVGAWLGYFLQINMVIYVNMYLLVPRLLIKGKTILYMIALPILMVGTVIGIGLLQETTIDNAENNPSLLESLSSLSAFLLLIVGLTTIKMFKYHLDNLSKIHELENVTMAIELANLQSQINPHFLFNMLNNANIMAWEDTGKASSILTELDRLLRYQVEEGSKEAVRLDDDIAFIRDYLELEKIRRDRFTYEIRTEGDTHISVPPLLFIPFVENAIKHNPENDSYVHITFRIVDDTLFFECVNPKARFTHKKKEGGIGLVNIGRRLNLLYGGKHQLAFTDENDIYTVKMEIKI